MSNIEYEYKTILDKKSRTIVIGYNDTDVIAEHNQKEIGRFSIKADEVEEGHPEKYILYHCSIEEAFRDCGISTIMFNACEELCSNFDIAKHFTDEGAAFINYMLAKVAKHWHEVKYDPRF